MNDEFESLKKNYREIEAPRYLETRIRAEVADRPTRNHGWLPVATTAVLAAAIVGILPMLWQGGTETPVKTTPSLSAIAAIKVEKPAGISPSLSKVRSVKRPPMPRKPRPSEPGEQTNSVIDDFEEKDHAHS